MDTTVCIYFADGLGTDEATSALDGTTRLLVFEAIRTWRKNRTTIVITHDLSQIGPDDFVYVLSQGRVVEQGFRRDLEEPREGEFYQMMVAQGATGGFLPVKDVTTEEQQNAEERDAIVEQAEEEARQAAKTLRHRSALGGYALAPNTELFQAVDTLARGSLLPPPISRRPSATPARFFPEDVITFPESPRTLKPRRSSLTISIPRSPEHKFAWKRSSLPFPPSSPSFLKRMPSDMTVAITMGTTTPRQSAALDEVIVEEFHGATDPSTDVKEEIPIIEDDDEFEQDKAAMRMTAMEAATKRRMNSTRRKWEEDQPPEMKPRRFGSKRHLRPRRKLVPPIPVMENVVVAKKSKVDERSQMPFMQLVKIFWPTVPIKSKFIFFFGLFFSLLNGAVTPVFAFLLSQLVVAVTTGEQSTSFVNKYAVVVLFLALANGVTGGLKYFLLELAAMNWVRDIRKRAFRLIMKQDRSWFDQSKNSAPLLVQVLIKDSESARELLSTVAGQFVVVVAMLGIGLIWALVQGWQLTLVGFAIGPVFGAATAIQSRLVAKFEHRNKRCREEVNKKYYDSVANIRAIRSMHLEGVFKEDFEKSLEKAVKSGINGAFVDGLGYGVANGLIYLSQGLYFLVLNGTFTDPLLKDYSSTSAQCSWPRERSPIFRCCKCSTWLYSPSPLLANCSPSVRLSRLYAFASLTPSCSPTHRQVRPSCTRSRETRLS
jgi:ATP-binding cassette, subfamily B (MDR/TAP), member 1